MNKLSTKLLLLILAPIAVLGILVVVVTMRTNAQIIKLQATKTASTIATQVITDRKHYVQKVVSKLKGTEFGAKEDAAADSSNVPLPATFVMGVADEISNNQNEYSYKLVSRWNVNDGNALKDDFLKSGFENLIEQEKQAKLKSQLTPEKRFSGWKPYTQVQQVDGRKVLRFITADAAVGASCVSCHNQIEQRSEVMATRKEAGVDVGHTFKLNDLMGAVAVDIDLEEAGAVAKAGSTTILLWVITSGAVLLGLSWLLIRRLISRPITIMVERLRDIAEGEGDLTQRVDASRKDEIGQLGKWFNEFVQKVHDLIGSVAIAADEVTSASSQIAGTNEEMAAGMGEQNQQITQISAAVEQMSASVIEVARKSSEASTRSQESGQIAEQGGEVVSQTVNDMQMIAEAVNSSAASVSELGKRGEQIGQIIEVINDIADQTNLLALNAAIEAARAGEHGRGFAVVADEVRKLADRTTKATEEISESIKAIQTETDQAVSRMNKGTEQVSEGVDRASQAGQSLEQIVAAAKDVSGMVQSIAAAAEQQSAAGEQVSRSIQAVSTVTNQVSEGSRQAAQSATVLSDKAQGLRGLVNKFKFDLPDRTQHHEDIPVDHQEDSGDQP
jgi:methyl-accepting chemotaxis protein